MKSKREESGGKKKVFPTNSFTSRLFHTQHSRQHGNREVGGGRLVQRGTERESESICDYDVDISSYLINNKTNDSISNRTEVLRVSSGMQAKRCQESDEPAPLTWW